VSHNPYESPAAADEDSRTIKDDSWWGRPCGGKDVLQVALPMVISTSFVSVMHFVDRMFLTWSSPAAMDASMQGGLAQWVSICFAIGIVSYVNTFVAQYHGAGHDERVGMSVWQGIWIGIFLTPLYLFAIPLAPLLFKLVGHSPDAQVLETTYYSILCWSSGPVIIVSAMSTFFTGRGLTWVTMVVSGVACTVNIVGDYLLVFDKLHLGLTPIAGAAWATVASHLVSLMCYALWMYWPKSRVRYGLTTSWRIDRALMKRLIGYGGSSGIHFLVEGAGFTLLVMMVGRLGEVASMSTTLAFSVNIVAFIPMVGLGIAISTLVGQQLGNNRPDLAERATWTGMSMGLVYGLIAALLYVGAPQVFLYPYEAHANPEEFAPIRGTTIVLLRFVALYFLFDTMQIVFACALKGAGDTLFVLLVAGTASIASIVIGQLGATYYGGGLYWWWTVMTVWLSALALAYLARFLHGGWKRMRVIEKQYLGQLPDTDEPSPAAVPELVE
jgi:MATE family multidrug resistance protein